MKITPGHRRRIRILNIDRDTGTNKTVSQKRKNNMKYSILIICVSIILISGCAYPVENSSPASTLLWYEQPAEKWVEALPLGNGRLGAMVFGGVDEERLQLNEESLWAGEPIEVYPDNFSENIKRVQQLVLEGDISGAKKLGIKTLTKRPTSYRSYEPLADIFIKINHAEKFTNYKRQLNLVSGIASVSYSSEGNNYLRESYISAVDDILVTRISADNKGSVSGEVRLSREKDAAITASGKNMIILDGQIVDIASPEGYDDNPGGSGPAGEHMKFSGKLVVNCKGGTVHTGNGSVFFENADEAIIFFTAATDYNLDNMNFDRSIIPEKIVKKTMDAALLKPYKQLLADHISEHSSMFNRVKISLDETDISNLPIDKRLEAIREGKTDPSFTSLYFQFGRYLLMSSSRTPGRLPANLQGIWNDRMWAPWEADYHLNINLQMNYWPADLCNLSETIDPLTGWFTQTVKKGEISAKKLYGSDGWVLFLATNPFGRSTPSASTILSQFMNASLDPLPGAWMALSLWRHYEFTGDREYLNIFVWPVLRGASRFLLDYMVADIDGSLVIVPSTSPENNFINPATGESIRTTKASTYHSTIVREVFSSTLKTMKILDINNGIESEINEALTRIPPIKIGRDGTIMEWIEDYEEVNPGHRHVSHLMGLHPFAQITEITPDLFDASARTIERRLNHGGGHTGWSRAWVVNFFARLGNGNAANEHLNHLFSKSTNDNLFDEHPPFQIDGNFGGTAGVAEMLVQSHAGYIDILPALPSEWQNGKVSGLCARGGFVIDMEWADNKIQSIKLLSRNGGFCRIRCGDQLKEFDTLEGKEYEVEMDL
jgi:alpha-L-fucosidase 2